MILALRLLILLMVIGAILMQVFGVPFIAHNIERGTHLPLAIPYGIAGAVVILCGEIALVAVWMLLSMVSRDAIFTDRAFRWVDLILVVGVVGTVLVFALGVHCYFVVNPLLDAPGLVAIAAAGSVAGAAAVLLVFVMRGLLRKATDLRAELDEVV